MEPSDNRSRILKVALGLFAAHGYDATGVQEIVAMAGVTKPTLYHYFGSKRGLLDALLDEYVSGFLHDLRAAAVYAGGLPATLARVVAVYLGFAAARPTFYRFLLSLQFCPPEHEAYGAAARIFEEQRRLLEGMFVAAAGDHGNMRGRHRRYAYSLMAVISGYAALQLNGRLESDERLRYDVVHQFSHGIYS
jgi:AcrR family transcriptional regulator